MWKRLIDKLFTTEYRVTNRANYWLIEFKTMFRWKPYTGKIIGGKPIRFFEKRDAELRIEQMTQQVDAFKKQIGA